MNIRNWPMDRIMQLPDCCFGRRFSVCVHATSINKAPAWDISEMGLPEKCVLWEVVVSSLVAGMAIQVDYVRMALGDQLPTWPPEMDVLEPLMPGLGVQGPEPRRIHTLAGYNAFHMRRPIAAMGKRLVLEFQGATTVATYASVVCEFSSIPTEVPDWLFSEKVRSLL